MQSKRSRVDRFLSAALKINRKEVKLLLAQKRVKIDGAFVLDVQHFVDEFSHVTFDQETLQKKTAHYLMLHKPKGVVSATRDEEHQTVIDLLDVPFKNELHIAGRLDYNSTGLLLLTNNGRWSRSISSPEKRVPKQYRVTLEKPISTAMQKGFADGIYFEYENLMTQAAELRIVSDFEAIVVLQEGRYHQIKRMFGHFQNKVLDIHRFAIGHVYLDENLKAGQSRSLTQLEVDF